MVAEGEVPGRQNVKAGTVLYKVLHEFFDARAPEHVERTGSNPSIDP